MHSEKIDLLATALIDFQSKQKAIKPNAENKFLKNKYADLQALVDGTKDNLTRCNLAVTQLLDDTGVSTFLLHSSGQFIGAKTVIEPTEGKGTNAAQQMGIAITYTRRYAYAAILSLVTDEDTDGATTNKEASKKSTCYIDADVISEAQSKRLYAIRMQKNVSDGDEEEILNKYGYGSSKEILKKDYDDIIKEIEFFSPEEEIESMPSNSTADTKDSPKEEEDGLPF